MQSIICYDLAPSHGIIVLIDSQLKVELINFVHLTTFRVLFSASQSIERNENIESVGVNDRRCTQSTRINRES